MSFPYVLYLQYDPGFGYVLSATINVLKWANQTSTNATHGDIAEIPCQAVMKSHTT